MSEATDVVSIAAAINHVPTLVKDERGIEWLMIPGTGGSYTAKQLTPDSEITPKPGFVSGGPLVATTQSLIDYVNRFKNDSTVIFANLDTAKIVACVDYHTAGSAAAGLRKHHAVLQLAHSKEWRTWTGVDGVMMEQKKFARFLEEHKLDITSPPGATLLEMVLDMEKGVNMRVGRKMLSAGSDRGISGSSLDIDGTELPPVWTLAIPVYLGENPVVVTAYARDEIDDGKLMVGFKLSKIESVIEAELTRIADEIAEHTKVPVMLGSPGNV
ncbi:hypothetical protein ABIB86_000468 [Bradyrhizobium sp. JR1.7]|uniref:DUF2303 family protein n=1 Tax=unclassified Bradyrhizobium TaxID=2631580 RepID=UPI00339A461E